MFAIELLWACVAAVLNDAETPRFLGFHAATLLAGYAISAVLGMIGLARRRLLKCAWALLLMPVYWLLLSVAAWRALFQFVFDPYRWEKTETRLARTSRLAGRVQRYRFKSAAASSGRRFMLNGATNRPALSIR